MYIDVCVGCCGCGVWPDLSSSSIIRRNPNRTTLHVMLTNDWLLTKNRTHAQNENLPSRSHQRLVHLHLAARAASDKPAPVAPARSEREGAHR